MTTSGAPAQLDIPAIVKEAGGTALIVLLLAFTMVGFRTVDVPGGLEIVTRFGDVAMAAVLGFLGRALLILQRHGRPLPVLIAAGAFAVLVGISLIADVLAGETGALDFLQPFGDPVVNTVLALMAGGLAIRAANVLRHANRSAESHSAAAELMGQRVKRVAAVLGPVLLFVAVVLPFLPSVDRRILDIAILVVTYFMLGWGLNIVVGLAGLLDLGYVAFYAVGAYSYALLATNFDLGFWVCLPFAGIMAAFAGILLGFPVLRLRGDYLAIVTLGFGEMIRIILLNWYDFTNGPDGISGIPRPTLFGLAFTRRAPEGGETFHDFFGISYAPINRIIFLYYLILIMALVTNAFTMRIRRLPVGAGLGGLARGRNRLPFPRHQPPQYQADGVFHRRHVRRLRAVPSSPPARGSSAPKALLSSSPP